MGSQKSQAQSDVFEQYNIYYAQYRTTSVLLVCKNQRLAKH